MNRTAVRRGGFTLIELMLVIVIIGVLAAMVVPSPAAVSVNVPFALSV